MKSRFEQFVRDAAKAPLDVETTPSHNEYLNYQTQTLLQEATHKAKVATNFVKMGLMATIMAVPLLSMADNLATDKYQSEMQQTLTQAKNAGYLSVNPKISIKQTSHEHGKYEAKSGAENHLDKIGDSQCHITISFSDKGQSLYMGHSEEVKKLTLPQNEMQEKLTRQFFLLHEASHCELNETQEAFLIKNNPSLQKEVNYYFKDMVGTNQNDSAYTILHENFADTYAAMQLIKNYGATQDVLKVINDIALERHDSDLNTKSRVDSHYTHFSLSDVFNHIDKVLSSNPQEIKQLALEVANKGTHTVLSTYSENLSDMFSGAAIVKSAYYSFSHQSMSNFLSTYKHNADNPGFIQKLGTEVLNTANIERVADKTFGIVGLNEEQNERAFEISKNKFLDNYKADPERMEKALNGYMKYVKSFNVSPDKTSAQTSGEDLESKKSEMLKQYHSRLSKPALENVQTNILALRSVEAPKRSFDF